MNSETPLSVTQLVPGSSLERAWGCASLEEVVEVKKGSYRDSYSLGLGVCREVTGLF